jgi:hypothetical protein
MACRGVHFSIDYKQVAVLKALPEANHVDAVKEGIESVLWVEHRDRCQETDKAWDAIHRALTDGRLTWTNGRYPLNHAILGGERLYHGTDYILSLKAPPQVLDISLALISFTRARLRQGFDRIDAKECGYPVEDREFEYTWEWFQPLAEFYRRAAADPKLRPLLRRSVIRVATPLAMTGEGPYDRHALSPEQ